MQDQYSIDNLIIKFNEHVLESEKNAKESEEKYLAEYGEEHPNKMDFNICRAFLSMCEEIKMLKEK